MNFSAVQLLIYELCDSIFMKKSFFVLFKISLLILPVVLTSCDGSGQQALQSSEDAPEVKQTQSQVEVSSVLQSFINASIARQYDVYYELLSEQDRAVKSREVFLQEKQPGGVTLADAFYDKITYRIEHIEVDKDKAKVSVEYNYPNVEFMIKDMFGLSILSDFTDQEIIKMKEQLSQAYQGKSLPMKTTKRQFVLVRQPAGWRVLLGWKKALSHNVSGSGGY